MPWAKYEGYLVKFLLIIGSLALLAMMVVVAFNIFGRWVNRPIMGAIEIAGLCGGIVASIAIPYGAREKRNVVVDVIVSRLPPRVKGFFDTFTFLVALGIVGFVVYVAFKEARYAASFGEETLVASVPTSPVKFIWAIGLTLLFLVLIRDIISAFRKGIKR
jgi:TRAP-type C4-dicarboxylate transport system permease small subunit